MKLGNVSTVFCTLPGSRRKTIGPMNAARGCRAATATSSSIRRGFTTSVSAFTMSTKS